MSFKDNTKNLSRVSLIEEINKYLLLMRTVQVNQTNSRKFVSKGGSLSQKQVKDHFTFLYFSIITRSIPAASTFSLPACINVSLFTETLNGKVCPSHSRALQ
jgi:hypothetical protein